MTIAVTPEIGVPIPTVLPYVDLRARAAAACETANLLKEHGFVVEDDDTSNNIATTLAFAYAKDPEKTSKAVSSARTATLPPASLVKVNSLLEEFGSLVAREAEQVRNLVVNKLILETADADPKIRIKALELVGKMSGIDLFTDRKEVTIKHESSDELKQKLREKLEKLREVPGEAEFETLPPVFDGEPINVDEVLGIKPTEPAPEGETHG